MDLKWVVLFLALAVVVIPASKLHSLPLLPLPLSSHHLIIIFFWLFFVVAIIVALHHFLILCNAVGQEPEPSSGSGSGSDSPCADNGECGDRATCISSEDGVHVYCHCDYSLLGKDKFARPDQLYKCRKFS